MWSFLGLISTAFIALVLGNVIQENPTVNIASGVVVGSKASDGNYYEFLGIPYAGTTAGINRFKAPTPPPTFSEPFLANKRDIKCVRPLGTSKGYEGIEDCLMLNVFTSNADESSSFPVIVWVKGEEFDEISENEPSFKHFVEKDTVVVTLNFRKSIFGFLCLGTETAPGNAGLKDIIAGLNWIKENIAQFGGNPESVTLIGHGSGAALVDLITLSDLAKGLVHKAILQSGNALAPWAVGRNNLPHAASVAELLGHTLTDIESLSQLLQKASIPALMAVINEINLTDNSFAFSPCIEKEDLNNVQPIFTKSPFEIIDKGEFLNIPLIIGFVDYEGTIRLNEAVESDWLEKMDVSFTDFLQADLQFESTDVKNTVAENIKTYYFGDESITNANIDKYIKYHGDTMILVSAIRNSRMRTTTGSSVPMYMYQFSFKGILGEPFVDPSITDKAAHREELAYLFKKMPLMTEENEIPAIMDLMVADILIERWTNFAKEGIPTSENSKIIWQPYSANDPHYIRILDDEEISKQSDSNIEVNLLDPHSELLSFWEDIYAEHFLDAYSRWDLNTREEEEGVDDSSDKGSGDSDESSGDIDEGSGDSGESEEEGSGEGSGDGAEDGGEGDGSPDSASTAIAYTFTIISFFAILDKFHSSIILS